MRFRQLVKESGVIVRKRMYKSGKTWIVASVLSFIGGITILLGTPLNIYASTVTNESVDSGSELVDGSSTNSNPEPLENAGYESGDMLKDNDSSESNENQVSQEKSDGPVTNGDDPDNASSEKDSIDNDDSITEPPANGTNVNDIANDNIPEQIKAEGIYQQGMDGTAPYYITNKKNVYFLDGELSKEDTEKILGNSDYEYQTDHVDRIDTSLAKNKVYTPEDSTELFSSIGVVYGGGPNEPADVEHLTTVDFSKLDTSRTKIMTGMFSGSFFKKLDLSSFDTSNVISMDDMFSNLNLYMDACDLNVSNFDISNVSDKNDDSMVDGLYNTFAGSNVKTLNLSGFKKTKVTTINSMFFAVKAGEIIMPNFDTSNIDDWERVFEDSDIGHLDISNWDMRNRDEIYESVLFDGAKIGSITLGPNNKFIWIDTPKSPNGSWINVGRGTMDNPEGNLSFQNQDSSVNNKKGITRYYDGSGKTGVETFIPYMDVIHGDLSVPTTMDDKPINNTEFKNLFGQPGKTIQLKVPVLDGYHSNEDFIEATVNPDRTITTSDTIIYVKDKAAVNNGHHNSNGSNVNKVNIQNNQQYVATLIGNGEVSLYNLNGNTFNLNNSRALAAGTDWYSDKYVTTKDMTYYRVSTNEWVKASDVYTYSPDSTIFDNGDKITYLVDSKNQLIKSRALNPRSSWLVDRVGYLGDYSNPIRTYRVATNEFVKI